MKICLVCEGITETPRERCSSCGTLLVHTSEVHYPMRRGESGGPSPMVGAVVGGKYRIEGLLGRGGMGTVYRAVHEVSLVPVALKVLHPRFTVRADYRAAFLAEARKAGKVVHEHTARILDVGEDEDGTVFLAMELVEGAPLEEWLAGPQPLPAAWVVDLMIQVARGLRAAHAAGVVHRDLSPRNVMVESRSGAPFVKIVDFGIAKGGYLPVAARQELAAQVGAPPGFANPPFSSPEHLAGRDVDGRSDLYALGVIGYVALAKAWPVEGETREELARATLEGRRRPLRAPGAPKRLVRLVERMLEPDPGRRPASVDEVLRELERLQRAEAPVLRGVAVGLALLAAAGWLYVRRAPEPAFLQLRPGMPFTLRTQAPGESDPYVERTSSALAELRMLYGGFDAASLQIVAYHRGSTMTVGDLHPRLGERGELTISAGESERFASFLSNLAIWPDPVVLMFRTPRGPPLGYARVLVDDEPPQVELVAEGIRDGVLYGGSRVRARVADKGSLVRLRLEVRVGAEGAEAAKVEELEPRPGSVDLTGALGRLLEGVTPWPDVELRVLAEDRAGNRGASRPLRVRSADLAAPGIEAVAGTRAGGRVGYGPDGARLRLRLSAAEPSATLRVRDPRGLEQVVALPLGTDVEVLVPPADGDVPYADGAWELTVRDAAGNLGPPWRGVLQFRSREVEARLQPGAVGRAVVLGRRIVAAGETIALELRCNPLFRPQSVRLEPTRVGLPAGGAARLVGAAEGRGRIELRRVPSGVWRLHVDLVESAGADRARETYELRCLHEPPRLLLPDTAGRRFLAQLENDVLARRGDAYTQGAAWRCVPDDPRLVRGRVWFGPPDDLAPRSLEPVGDPADRFVDGLRPVRGENLLALELHDVLGRPVEVRLGARPAPTVKTPAGTRARVVARFWYHDRPIDGPVPVPVEFGEPARVRVAVRLPFREGDVLRLRPLGTPARVVARGPASTLLFEVPFRSLMAWLGVDPRSREELESLGERPMRAFLEGPGGVLDVPLVLRPTRTTLRVLRLGDLAARPGAVPASLGAVRMAPVLGPQGPFEDPVPADLPSRPTFRPLPPLGVRNVETFYLQETEVSRALYAELARAAERLATGDRSAAWRRLVHPMDPAGAQRLERMAPAWPTPPSAWRAAVTAAPERPVTGVSYFQAYTAARIAGWLLGDPELLRLPSGVELELAALGSGPRDGVAVRLNGVGGPRARLRLEAHRRAARAMDAPDSWPPTPREQAAMGDAVRGERGVLLVGLDFGVREWVVDLPFVGGDDARIVLAEWLSDHGRHLRFASDLQAAARLGPEVALEGVVRGVALGETAALVDAVTGASLAARDGPVPATVPGVTRIAVLRRDGLGLLDEPDPRLRRVGFRLAGGARFVARARFR